MKNVSTHRLQSVLYLVRVMLGSLLGVIIGTIAYDWYTRPSPYWNVEVINKERDGSYQYITANFATGNCERLSVVFVGSRLGLIDDLTADWENLNGATPNQDRTAGEQTLEGRLFVGSTNYDWYEIRTRHRCDGAIVERVFLRINVQ